MLSCCHPCSLLYQSPLYQCIAVGIRLLRRWIQKFQYDRCFGTNYKKHQFLCIFSKPAAKASFNSEKLNTRIVNRFICCETSGCNIQSHWQYDVGLLHLFFCLSINTPLKSFGLFNLIKINNSYYYFDSAYEHPVFRNSADNKVLTKVTSLLISKALGLQLLYLKENRFLIQTIFSEILR